MRSTDALHVGFLSWLTIVNDKTSLQGGGLQKRFCRDSQFRLKLLHGTEKIINGWQLPVEKGHSHTQTDIVEELQI